MVRLKLQQLSKNVNEQAESLEQSDSFFSVKTARVLKLVSIATVSYGICCHTLEWAACPHGVGKLYVLGFA